MGWRWTVVCGIILTICGQSLEAQRPSKTEPLTVAALQKRIKFIEGNAEFEPALRDDILEYLKEAVERLEIAQEELEKAERLERSLPQVPDSLRAVEARLAKAPTTADPAIIKVADVNELERMVETRSKQLDGSDDSLRKRIDVLEAELAKWRTRPEELVNELAEVEGRLREIDDKLETLPNSGEAREAMQAHQIFLLSRRQRAVNEQRALNAESAWFKSTAAADLVQAQRELASRELSVKTAELDLLQTELAKRRGNEADQRVQQAEAAVAQASPQMKPLALENLALAKERHDLTDKIQDLENHHEKTTTSLLDLEKEFDRTQTMVKDVGMTDSIGLLLRQQRAKLMNPRGMRSSLLHRSDLVRDTRMRLFQLEAERLTLVDVDVATAKRASELALKSSKPLTTELKGLLTERRQLVKGLDSDYSKYLNQLVDLDNDERRLLELTTKYADFVDERVLWIRTGQAFGHEQLVKATTSTAWITDPQAWRSVLGAVRMNFERLPFYWITAGLAFVIWFGTRPVLKRLVQQCGDIAAEDHCPSLSPTMQTISLTMFIASGWPLLIWFLGFRLDHSASVVPFVHAVAAGLLRCATFALPLEVFRITCMRGGLAERHFKWPESSIVRWRRNLGWYIPAGMVLIGLIALTEGIGDEHRLDSLGRFTFLIFAGLTTVFCYLTIRRPKYRSSDEQETAVAGNDGDIWSYRFWRFCPLVAVSVAFGLLALGWAGYFYTALQLTWRLQSTTWLFVGLLLLRATIRRWIALERHRMAVLQDQELQSITEAGLTPGNSGHNQFLFPRWTWPDFRLNLTQIVTQMRRLLDTGLIAFTVAGLWLVWADVTPALNILDRFTLWNTTIEEIDHAKDSTNVTSGQTIKRLQPVTAADLGLAMLIVAVAVVAGRNIPGLVEVILLEHLSVDAGVRFAATCLVRYAIFVAGVCLAFAQIRIGWNNVQWLVAAASVGLGFGLQEIFANFVSGIILLFERPMRVGDVITVGDTTGTVSRIRFRATTIVDGDRKELIVPNKDFITGKLLNWTLSDRVNRFAVKIVVGSNNDPVRVRRLLLEVAAQQPSVLREPAPTAAIEDLNGGLTFVLRAFLPTLDGRATAINDLYASIHKRFEAEGVEMPRPAHEIYIKTDAHDPHSSSPPPPHQPLSGVPTKKWST